MNQNMKQSGDELSENRRLTDTGQAVLFVLFMTVWITDLVLHYADFLTVYITPYLRIPLAAVFFLIAIYMAVKGMSAIYAMKAGNPGVIRTGVFGMVRHPVYLAEILLYLGFLMINISLAAVAVWLITVTFLHYISCREEKALSTLHGDEYTRYRTEVPMWLPVLRTGQKNNSR
jgi:protein-S-isoprenylcysteine O-methyltransferase Ste14